MASNAHKTLRRLWLEASGLCHYCGVKTTLDRPGEGKPQIQHMATKDHYIPKAEGGSGGDNIVLSCYACNHQKGGGLPDEFIRDPYPLRDGPWEGRPGVGWVWVGEET